MAGQTSGRKAYWFGALVGVGFSAALAVALSVSMPMGTTGNQQVAAAPEPEVTAPTPEVADNAEPVPTPEPAEPAPVAPEPEPTVAPVTPPPAPSPVAVPEPAPEPVVEEPDTEVALLAPEPETTAPPPRDANALPPFKAYSEIYRDDASLPLLAIVLTGVSGAPGDEQSAMLDELLLMPGPLAIVISPDAADPRGMALDIRDAGFEALIGMTAQSFGGGDDEVGSAAGLMRGAGEVIGVAALGPMMEDNDAATVLVDAAAAEGMGVLDVTRDGGSVAFRLASARDVPAAGMGRRFDENPSSALVFQSLERAAFDARRTGAFIVVGEATPAVLTGLRRWMSVKANKSVAVAPLSVVIDKISRQ